MVARTPMPSPRGTNHARLFVPSRSGYALDAAPSEPTARPSKTLCDRIYAYLEREHGVEAADSFWSSLFGPDDEQAEDVSRENETYAGESVVREAVSKDGLPGYRRDGMPNNALAGDCSPQAVVDMMRRNIKIGPA